MLRSGLVLLGTVALGYLGIGLLVVFRMTSPRRRMPGATPAAAGLAYEDAGDGFGYENGDSARREVSCEASDDRVTVSFGEREGSFVPQRETVTLELRGVDAPRGVTVGGEAAESRPANGGIQVTLPETAAGTTVEVAL